MSARTNDLGQPIGEPMPSWTPARATAALPWSAAGAGWSRSTRRATRRNCSPPTPPTRAAACGPTFLTVGPFRSPEEYRAWADRAATSEDPLFFAILDAAGRAVGVATLMRIEPAMGVIEVGNIAFSPLLQRTPAATEAMYLMMCRAFDELGYRRYEWKCDSLNAPSRAAAERLGFRYEGLFRQALIYKGRNRDTAWYSITDREWPARKAAFEAWLDPANFDAEGRQREPLSR
ncbi:MAG: GNAT family protein [Geminicoccaceae bacterium]